MFQGQEFILAPMKMVCEVGYLLVDPFEGVA